MATFSATTTSVATVGAARADVWAALTDPVLLPRLTPLLDRIEADGDRWTWFMTEIGALGVSIKPSFTETMVFDEGRTIEYHHTAPAGVRERAGAEGWYRLDDVTDGTRLSIRLTLCVELPLPRASRGAVERVMRATMARTGARFSTNLLQHLGARQIGEATTTF